jgi:chromosome segregation ATPase
VSVQPLQEDEKLAAAGRRPQASSDGGLWVAQERLWQNEHQSAEQAIALIERDQRISALRAECDWLASQLDEERQRRQALEPELDLARGEWAAAEKRASEYETGFHHSSTRLQQAEAAVNELSHQLEVVKTERSEAVLDLAQQHETFAELNLQLEKARAERAELEQILGRARANLDRTAAELAIAESAAEQSAAEAGQIKATLAHLRAELGLAVAERDKLQGLVREDHDLAEYVEAKIERDRVEGELKETQARLDGLLEKIESLTTERESLKRERTELQLKVAALRDAHDDTQLQQDNEVLRRMVERLNEELKEALPDIAKRKRRTAPGGVVGGLARAALARCFVPDPDVAEGR